MSPNNRPRKNGNNIFQAKKFNNFEKSHATGFYDCNQDPDADEQNDDDSYYRDADFDNKQQEKINKIQIGSFGGDAEADYHQRQEELRLKRNKNRRSSSVAKNIDIDENFITNGFKKCYDEDPNYLHKSHVANPNSFKFDEHGSGPSGAYHHKPKKSITSSDISIPVMPAGNRHHNSDYENQPGARMKTDHKGDKDSKWFVPESKNPNGPVDWRYRENCPGVTYKRENNKISGPRQDLPNQCKSSNFIVKDKRADHRKGSHSVSQTNSGAQTPQRRNPDNPSHSLQNFQWNSGRKDTRNSMTRSYHGRPCEDMHSGIILQKGHFQGDGRGKCSGVTNNRLMRLFGGDKSASSIIKAESRNNTRTDTEGTKGMAGYPTGMNLADVRWKNIGTYNSAEDDRQSYSSFSDNFWKRIEGGNTPSPYPSYNSENISISSSYNGQNFSKPLKMQKSSVPFRISKYEGKGDFIKNSSGKKAYDNFDTTWSKFCRGQLGPTSYVGCHKCGYV